MHLATSTVTYALLSLMMMSCVQSQCDTIEPQEDCITLFNLFQQSLVSTPHNLFRLQVVFYPPTRITPTLVKVTYNPIVTCDPSFEAYCSCNQTNDSYTLGWSNRELYQVFHPAVINLLRFQLPFWILQYSEQVLTENLNVDAFLWDGTTKLPSVTVSLNVSLFPENFTNSCPPGDDMILKALGEFNHWLKAYAKVAQRGEEAIKFASPDDKGFTLPHAAVEQYNHRAINDIDAEFGRGLLICIYTIDLLLIFFAIPIFLPLMIKMFQNTFVDTNGAHHSKFLLAASSLVAFLFIVATIVIEFIQVLKQQHEFANMKLAFITIISVAVLFLLFIILPVYICFTLDCCNLYRVVAWLVVGSLSTFAAIILLSFAPIIILMFAHPMNSSGLLALHIALLYTSTIIMGIFFHVIYNAYNRLWGNPSPSRICVLVIITCVLYTVLMIAFILLTYVGFILLYQFIIARSDYHGPGPSFGDIFKYTPSIVIGVFGFLLSKGIFSQDKNKEKAKTMWITLGEILNTHNRDPHHQDHQQAINALQSAFSADRQAEANWIDLEKRTAHPADQQQMPTILTSLMTLLNQQQANQQQADQQQQANQQEEDHQEEDHREEDHREEDHREEDHREEDHREEDHREEEEDHEEEV